MILGLIISIPVIWLIGWCLGISALAEETAEHTVPVSLPKLLWPHWIVAVVSIPLFGWIRFANGRSDK